jgi:magnesium transporter
MSEATRPTGPAEATGAADETTATTAKGENGAGPAPSRAGIGIGLLHDALVRPVSLVRHGRKRRGSAAHRRPTSDGGVIGCAVYQDGERIPFGDSFLDAPATTRRHHGSFAWLGLFEPGPDLLANVAAAFRLDSLAVREAASPVGRPRLERYADGLFLVLRTSRYVREGELRDDSELVDTGKITVIVAAHHVVTVRHGRHSELTGLRARLEQDPAMLRQGPAAVLHAICEHVVSGHLAVADQMTADIDEIESQVFDRARLPSTEKVYQLKREVLQLKHAVAPLGTPLRALAESVEGHADGHSMIPVTIRRYLRAVTSDLEQVSGRVAHADELLTSILQANLTQVTIAQNEDMRRISAWVAIAAVPTSLAGIYGMNFQVIPGAAERWGFGAAILVMVVVCGALYRTFRRVGWL